MARDGNGRDHKAAGRPDGGQYEEKAGQGLDDDLEEVPTTAESVAPDEGWWASLENDPEAAAGPEAGREPEPDGPAAGTGGDAESEDGPWWIVPGDDAPEVREAGRSIMNAPSREVEASAPETKDARTGKPEPVDAPKGDRTEPGNDGGAKAENQGKDRPKPADPVADVLKELEGVGDVMKARAVIARRPRGVRVAVVRAQPFDRISMLADLTGDPDKARGYHSMLDGLPYTKDSPKDRLRDMASRGDVRAAAALAAYGDDDARRWLSTLPVGDHRAVQLALRAWTPPEARTAPKPPAASKPAPKPADKAEGKAMASKPAERDAGVRSSRSGWSTARHPARKPRKPPFRERMRGGLRRLRTIWSGVWTKWLAVFRR